MVVMEARLPPAISSRPFPAPSKTRKKERAAVGAADWPKRQPELLVELTSDAMANFPCQLLLSDTSVSTYGLSTRTRVGTTAAP